MSLAWQLTSIHGMLQRLQAKPKWKGGADDSSPCASEKEWSSDFDEG